MTPFSASPQLNIPGALADHDQRPFGDFGGGSPCTKIEAITAEPSAEIAKNYWQ